MSETTYKTGTLGLGTENIPQEVPTPEVAAQEPTPQATEETPQAAAEETNSSVFNFIDEEPEPQRVSPEPTPQAAAQQQTEKDWKELLKSVDKSELYKELGLSEFAVEINEHLRNGGKAIDYLNAKAIDYNQWSDADIMKSDLKSKYPTFTAQEIERIFNRQYGISDAMTEEEQADVELRLKADAYEARGRKIQEQSKFKIAEPTPVDNTGKAQQDTAVLEQQMEAARNWYAEHEATKALFESKRVAINLGDNGNFNFKVEKPEVLMKAITDADTWQKITSNKQGEPDVAKMQKIALYAFNPEQFESDLVNYGKSIALKSLVQEAQNVSAPTRVLPAQESKGKVDWSKARSGTVGTN